jgi:hypothetical protein
MNVIGHDCHEELANWIVRAPVSQSRKINYFPCIAEDYLYSCSFSLKGFEAGMEGGGGVAR